MPQSEGHGFRALLSKTRWMPQSEGHGFRALLSKTRWMPQSEGHGFRALLSKTRWMPQSEGHGFSRAEMRIILKVRVFLIVSRSGKREKLAAPFRAPTSRPTELFCIHSAFAANL